MIIAFIVTAVAIYLSFLARKESNRYALPLAFVVITVFLSLGYNWGNDVSTYEIWFHQYNDMGISPFDFKRYYLLPRNVEYGWALINILSYPVDFYGMRAILFCFENLVIYLLIKRTVPRDYYWMALFIYTMNSGFMLVGSSMMRQWLSICIIVLGFLFLEKKHWIIYIVLVLIASSIHVSAIICLPFVMLPFMTYGNIKTKIKWVLPLIIIYYIFFVWFIEDFAGLLIAEDMYTNYTDSKYSSGIGIMVIAHVFIYGYMIVNIDKIRKDKRIYIVALLGYFSILPILFYSGLASRLGLFFTVFTICAYPTFLKQAQLTVSNKYTMTTIIIVITLYNYYIFWTDPMWLRHYGRYITLFEAGILK